jgi:hypothetical protein
MDLRARGHDRQATDRFASIKIRRGANIVLAADATIQRLQRW